MGQNKDHWWRGVPWGLVSVTAYLTALACVGIAQVMEPGGAMLFVKDYQTLIAGLATMAALLIAAEQLKRQSTRDAVDARRHYEAELDAMRDLDTAVTRISNGAGRTHQTYDNASPIEMDRTRWARLLQETNVSLSPAVARLMSAVEEHNTLFAQSPHFTLAFNTIDQRRVNEARLGVRTACVLLREDVQKRTGVVLRLIETTS